VFSDQASYSGYLIPYGSSYALYITKDDIVKVGSDYYMMYNGVWSNLDDVPPPVEKTNNMAVSIISIIAIGIVLLIIGGKMDLLKTHPRASAFVSLLIGTLVLYGISSVVNDMLNVFVVFTVEWGIYCIEYMIHQGTITETQAKKVEDGLIQFLKEKVS